MNILTKLILINQKSIYSFWLLLCFPFVILAQEKKPKVTDNHFIKTEVIEFVTDTICVREPKIIKIAKTIKLTVPPHTDSILLSNQKDFFGVKWQKADSIMYWQMIAKQNKPLYYQLKFVNKKSEVIMIIPHQVDCGECFHDTKIMIDMNKEYTKKQEVTLDIFSYKAKYMMISHDSSFENAKWQPYSPKMTWKLTQEQGIKKVYAKFRDSLNSLPVFVTDEIILDTQAPNKCTVRFLTKKEIKKIFHKIDKNVLYVSFQAEDAQLFRIGNIKDIEMQKWQIMEEFIAIENKWVNKQTIYVQFRDKADNITEILPLNH
jgi:hypothetical protein